MSPMFTRVALVATVALTAGLGVSTSANATTTTEDCAGQFAATQPGDSAVPELAPDAGNVLSGDGVTIDVLLNDTGHDLSVVGVTQGEHGYTCVNSDGTVNYYAAPGMPSSTDTFQYAVTDGNSYRTASVTVTIEGVAALTPKLKSKLVLKNGKVTKQAKVTFKNPSTNTRVYKVMVGNFRGSAPLAHKQVPIGATVTFTTKLKQLNYAVYVRNGANDVYVVDGTLNTRTGKFTTSQNSGRAARVAALASGH